MHPLLRSPTHLVLILESPASGTTLSALASDALQTLPQGKEVARGSLHSIRRGSFDVRSIASDGLRRTSLAKLSQLPLEAPITKVLSLLAQVQENCSQDESKLLDRVMEFLKREGLYSPQMKEIRTEDPVATDLIGALLTVSGESISRDFFVLFFLHSTRTNYNYGALKPMFWFYSHTINFKLSKPNFN